MVSPFGLFRASPLNFFLEATTIIPEHVPGEGQAGCGF